MKISFLKNFGRIALSVAVLSIALPTQLAGAQSAVSSSSPGDKLTLKEGTDVKLKFAQEISSKNASEGDPVNFVLADDLTVGT